MILFNYLSSTQNLNNISKILTKAPQNKTKQLNPTAHPSQKQILTKPQIQKSNQIKPQKQILRRTTLTKNTKPQIQALNKTISQKFAKSSKQNLKEISDLNKQHFQHKQDTKQLMSKSKMISKKMLLALQDAEQVPNSSTNHL
jgi:hypothetical protein